jgi:serine-type D-Ala-D-Ala carboxypeptidase (penicillin-binding protein 5/6)
VREPRRARLRAPGRRRLSRPGRALRAAVVSGAGLLVVALGAAGPGAAAASPPPPPQLDARAWILVDAGDGERLAAHAASASRPVASATKLMTANLALHELRPGQRLIAPAYAALPGESLLGLRAGERISVHDLLYGLLLASGNDAAAALAENISGSVPAFVQDMNREADSLGLRDTSYANPIGLDDPLNYSSARDLVALALRLRRSPLFRRIVDTPEIVLTEGATPRRIENRNNLVREVPWVNGIKTGHTLGARYVLVGSGTRKGVTLVSAVLGASSEAERDAATLALLRWGFSQYRRERPVKRGAHLASAEVRYSGDSLSLVASRGLEVTVRRGERIDVQVSAPSEVEGPLRRGQRVGRADVFAGGEPVGRVALLAARSVPEATLLERVDSGVPGPRAVLWLALGAGAGAIVIGIVTVLRRRRYAENGGRP